MILVSREVGSKELLPIIKKFGVQSELTGLPFGDFALEGNGPHGRISVGIERKTLQDMLGCVEDSRYSAHQLPGMHSLYDVSYLLIEGVWKPHYENGLLMQGFKTGFGFFKNRTKPVMYSKLRRYLFSVALANVQVIYTRDMEHTAYDICELYHYYQKKWEGHTSLQQMQEVAMPCLTGKPNLVRRWAAQLDGVGTKLTEAAGMHFKRAGQLAEADEQEWMKLGIGVKKARDIVKEING